MSEINESNICSTASCGCCGCDSNHSEKTQKIFTLRLLVSACLLIGLTVVDWPPLIELCFYFIAYLLAGAEVLRNATKNIVRGKIFDENFLMSLASICAFLIGETAEAAAVMIFYGIGETLQESAIRRSKKNIATLMNIRPETASLKTTDGFISVAPENVKIGDILLVLPGEKIPLDGFICQGSTAIDTKALTGESAYRDASVGDEVLSGSVNVSGLIEVQVSKIFSESTVSKIIELVQNASAKKAESEKFITKFARIYTPTVVAGAIFVAVLPPLFGWGTFSEWIYKALSFLIISCPCALVISIPISFFAGIGGAARQGVLVKGGNYLEALNKVSTIVFDKTGTLTKGEFTVSEIIPSSTVKKLDVLRWAAVAESHSTHPIAKSILSTYGATPEKPHHVTERAGLGIVAEMADGRMIHCGNAKLIREVCPHADLPNPIHTSVYVAVDTLYIGCVVLADEIKPGATQAIADLKKQGITKIIMLTGDRLPIAEEIAKKIGLDEYHAELLPQDKVAIFEEILQKTPTGEKVAFVGDGINDAPVLTRADIGIAMGGIGADAAIEAADVVLMTDELSKITTALKCAAKTRQVVLQNIVFSLTVKGAVMFLAVSGLTSIWFAIFADVGVALLALLNSLRAMRKP